MRRRPGKSGTNNGARGQEPWLRDWLERWGPLLGRGSLLLGLIYGLGWLLSASRAQVLGLPEGVIAPGGFRTYDAIQLVPRWVGMLPMAVAPSPARGAPLFLEALGAIALCILFSVSAARARAWGHPAHTVWVAALLLAGLICVLVLGSQIQGSAADLYQGRGLLVAPPRECAAKFLRPLSLAAARGKVCVLSLLAGREQDAALTAAGIIANMLWALVGLTAWSAVLWRRLTGLAEGPSPWRRGAAWTLQAFVVLWVGLSLKALVQWHSVLVPSNSFPLVRIKPPLVGTAADDEGAATATPGNAANPATPGTSHQAEAPERVAYLGAVGGVFYLYDCDGARMLILPRAPERTFEVQGEENVVRAAFVGMGPHPCWCFDEQPLGTPTGCSVPGCRHISTTGGASDKSPGRIGHGLHVPLRAGNAVFPPLKGECEYRSEGQLDHLSDLAEFTLQLWLKLDTHVARRRCRPLIHMRPCGEAPLHVTWSLEEVVSDRLSASMCLTWGPTAPGEPGSVRSAPDEWVANRWYWLSASFCSTGGTCEVLLFRDDEQLAHERLSGSFSTGDLNFILGSDGRNGLGGTIDQVKVWPCALTAGEIRRTYRQELKADNGSDGT
jgi:hypothetical protein